MPTSRRVLVMPIVSIARGGDLAYLYGTYELSFDEAPGKRTTDRGKIVEIWKKRGNGTWNCVVDTWNSDLPIATLPARS
jgi:ketosteroid isomerase-like protein